MPYSRTSEHGHRTFELAGLLHLSRPEAASTDVDIPGNSADEGVDAMGIRKLSPFAHVVSVADLVADFGTLVADFTATLDSGHPGLPPIIAIAPRRARKILLNAR